MSAFAFRHPLGIIFFMCLLLFLTAGIFFNADISDYQVSYLLISVFFVCFTKDFTAGAGFLSTVLGLFAVSLFLEDGRLFLFLAEIFLLFIILWLNRDKKYYIETGIITAAFLLHLFYIQNTQIDMRQHDLGGILAYMKSITKDGINWFGFNPWDMYYYFHQPLHFIINGYILSFETAIWSSGILAQEGLQYVSLFYVTATSFFAAGIFRELEFRAPVSYAVLILFSFNPTLTLFSGYISDDTPVMFWGTFFIYFLIKWYQYDRYIDIFIAALGFGFGVLTKLSILMLVLGVSFLFLCKLYFMKANRERVWTAGCIFVITAVPWALIWIVRNHILFDMQFYNVPDTAPDGQNFKYLDFYERISDFSMFFKPFISAPSVVDGNMWLSLIKTELFGEWDFSVASSVIYPAAAILYFINIVIKLLALGCCAVILFWCRKELFKQQILSLFFIILYLTLWGYSFKYAMDYPYACSTDYRLFALLLIPEGVILATVFNSKTAGKALFATAVFYAVLSSFIYSALVL